MDWTGVLEKLAQLERMVLAALNLRGDGTIEVEPGPSGMILHVPPEQKFLARIDGNNGDGSYSWQRVYQGDYTGTDTSIVGPHGYSNLRGHNLATQAWGQVSGGDSSNWIAYERQLRTYVPVGTFVWMYPHFFLGADADQQWVFDYTPMMADSDLDWNITTTLSAAITTITQSTASVTDAGKFPSQNKFLVTIDSEQLLIGAGFGTNSWTSIIRGWNSTTPATHTNGATVTLELSPIPDISRILFSLHQEVYPGSHVDDAVFLNMLAPIKVESGPDGSGFYTGHTLKYDPAAETISNDFAIKAIDLNSF